MKKYRYHKVNPGILSQMKQLREDGLTYKAIAEKFNISATSAQYWLSPKEKENSIKRSMKYYKKLTQEQRREKEKKRYEYKKKYFLERYQEDEEFRKRMIRYVQNSFKKRQKEWKKEGLCNICGRERKDKKWKRCERCRKKIKKRYI